MITLEGFKQYIGIDTSDTSKDALLQDLLDRAKQRVANFFGGVLEVGTYTEKHNYSEIIYPVHYPVVSVSRVLIDGNEVADYFVNRDYILLNTFTTGKEVEITYTAGFSTIPKDLEQVVYLVAARFVMLANTPQPGQTIDDRINEEIEEMLLPYRRFAL